MKAETADHRHPFTPPKIEPAEGPLAGLALLRVMVRNPVAAVPAAAYREPRVRTDPGGQTVHFLSAPGLVEGVLVRRHDDFVKSRIDSRLFDAILGNSLLTAEGPAWRWQRRLAAPAFRHATLSRYLPAMRAPFEELAAHWTRAPRPQAVHEAMTAAAIAVICRAFFSGLDPRDSARLTDAIARYLRPVSWTIAYGTLGLPRFMPHPGKIRMARAAAEGRRLVRAFVARRRIGRHDPPDLAQVLIDSRDPETGRALDDEDLVSMFLTLIAAGHETSANALSWALYCLAAQPERQEALAEQVRAVIGKGPVEEPHLGALAELTQFIEEVMRLLPPVPMMTRRALRPCEIGGETIEPDAIVFIPIYAIHRHAALWEAPDVFDPARFAPPCPAARPRGAFMPFGAGPRICLGASFAMIEMVAGLATLLGQVRFGLAGGEAPRPMHRITLRPERELVLAVAPRG